MASCNIKDRGTVSLRLPEGDHVLFDLDQAVFSETAHGLDSVRVPGAEVDFLPGIALEVEEGRSRRVFQPCVAPVRKELPLSHADGLKSIPTVPEEEVFARVWRILAVCESGPDVTAVDYGLSLIHI